MKNLEKLAGVNAPLNYLCAYAGMTYEALYPDRQITIAYGTRTRAEQERLVEQGKSLTRRSYHLTGDAVDMYIVDLLNGEVVQDKKDYEELDAILQAAADRMGSIVTWGGHWKRLVDLGHWQIEQTLADKMAYNGLGLS